MVYGDGECLNYWQHLDLLTGGHALPECQSQTPMIDGDMETSDLFTEAEAGDELPLRLWLTGFVTRGEPIPPLLREYTASVLTGTRRKRKGRKFWANLSRDIAIGFAVEHVRNHGGFFATRNVATRDKAERESACSIVAKALRRIDRRAPSEGDIEKIWAKYNANSKALERLGPDFLGMTDEIA